MLLTYDEDATVNRLWQLSSISRVIYAGSCTERLLATYEAYVGECRNSLAMSIRGILERIWQDIANREMAVDLGGYLDTCLSSVPRDDGEEQDLERRLAVHVRAAAACSLLAKRTGDPREAMQVGRRACQAAGDYVVATRSTHPGRHRAETRVLSHPLVQAELARQQRDVLELHAGVKSGELHPRIDTFRSRAQSESILPCAGLLPAALWLEQPVAEVLSA